MSDDTPGLIGDHVLRGPDHGKARLLTLDNIDRRTKAFRETHKLIREIEGDLGGRDNLSTGECQLIQRVAVLGALLTDVEARWIEGKPIDPQAYCTVINAQRRVLETIGLQRRQKQVASLRTYLTTRARLEAEDNAAAD